MQQVFPIVPAGTGVVATISVIALIMLLPLVLFAYMGWASRHVRFEISEQGLRIRGDLYGRFIARDDLVAQQARALDLTTDPDHALSWKTNGVGLPGYKAGWFKLKNGEKALVFVTDKTRVVYVPTRRGYSVLMSAADPPALVRALHQSSSSGG